MLFSAISGTSWTTIEPGPADSSSSRIRAPTSGCTMPFSRARSSGSAKTMSPSRGRSSAAVGQQHLGPERGDDLG